MDKEHILAEIRRTAVANGGRPLGRARFLAETGIRESDWHGRYWIRWSEAVGEAGFEPNELQGAYENEELLRQYADLIRDLGHFPVAAEVKMRARQDASFPSHNTFARFGRKGEIAARVFEFCVEQDGYSDVAEICAPVAQSSADDDESKAVITEPDTGFVYLMKSGRFYKIGRTNSMERRIREIGVQLPERLKLLHTISTDDPVGIERYWHQRFADKRKNGEWFELAPADVRAFRRRKFM